MKIRLKPQGMVKPPAPEPFVRKPPPRTPVEKAAWLDCTVTLTPDGAGGWVMRVTHEKDGSLLAVHVPPPGDDRPRFWNSVEYGCAVLQKAHPSPSPSSKKKGRK